MAKQIIALSSLDVSVSSYDAATGKIYIPRNKYSLIKDANLYEVFNEMTNNVLQDTKSVGLGASVSLPAVGDAVIELETNDMRAKGSNDDTLQILVSVSSSLVSNSSNKATETILANRSAKNLEMISDFSALAQGDYGFKIINDASGLVVANFSTVVCMSDGTTLSANCTTSGGDSDLSNFTLVTGTTITAPWTAVAVDAGAVLAYYSERP